MRTTRTTVNLDTDLLEDAAALLPGRTRTALLEEGLRALIAREAAQALARLGGSAPEADAPPRRRAAGAR